MQADARWTMLIGTEMVQQQSVTQSYLCCQRRLQLPRDCCSLLLGWIHLDSQCFDQDLQCGGESYVTSHADVGEKAIIYCKTNYVGSQCQTHNFQLQGHKGMRVTRYIANGSWIQYRAQLASCYNSVKNSVEPQPPSVSLCKHNEVRFDIKAGFQDVCQASLSVPSRFFKPKQSNKFDYSRQSIVKQFKCFELNNQTVPSTHISHSYYIITGDHLSLLCCSKFACNQSHLRSAFSSESLRMAGMLD